MFAFLELRYARSDEMVPRDIDLLDAGTEVSSNGISMTRRIVDHGEGVSNDALNGERMRNTALIRGVLVDPKGAIDRKSVV